jgi:hypothetical protein
MKLRRMRSMGHVAHMREERIQGFGRKPEGKWQADIDGTLLEWNVANMDWIDLA